MGRIAPPNILKRGVAEPSSAAVSVPFPSNIVSTTIFGTGLGLCVCFRMVERGPASQPAQSSQPEKERLCETEIGIR